MNSELSSKNFRPQTFETGSLSMKTPVLDRDEAREYVGRALGLVKPPSDRLNGRSTKDLVLVCIDTEQAPRDHPLRHEITEFGLCTLDTRDIKGCNPGRNGESWMSRIKSKHYRMSDCIGTNSDILDKFGNRLWAPDHFLFGESTVIDRKDLGEAVLKDLRIVDSNAEEDCKDNKVAYRNVMLIVHAWEGNESRTLKKAIGLHVDDIGTVTSIVDTQRVYSNPREPHLRLVAIMEKFGIEPRHMHNGANDAVYTLVVLVLGELFRTAFEGAKSGDWNLMNEVFPLIEVDGEAGVKVVTKAAGKLERKKSEEAVVSASSSPTRKKTSKAKIKATRDIWADRVGKAESCTDERVLVKLQGV